VSETPEEYWAWRLKQRCPRCSGAVPECPECHGVSAPPRPARHRWESPLTRRAGGCLRTGCPVQRRTAGRHARGKTRSGSIAVEVEEYSVDGGKTWNEASELGRVPACQGRASAERIEGED
jgi:hypothetical protein